MAKITLITTVREWRTPLNGARPLARLVLIPALLYLMRFGYELRVAHTGEAAHPPKPGAVALPAPSSPDVGRGAGHRHLCKR
mgnify:CR=1 FL=1